MRIDESVLSEWAKGPGTTEATKCDNAESVVRNAIKANATLSAMDLSVFPQGSFRARTNVPRDSDVDICVRHNSVFFGSYPSGLSREDFGNVAADLTYAVFKNLVGKALTDYLGTGAVTRGNKAFDIHETSYHIDADVVAAFTYRVHGDRSLLTGQYGVLEGIRFYPDQGSAITNWPQQNYDNGVAKNARCGRHYKRVVRILKRLCYQMRSEGIGEAQNVGSFLMECLIWNVPDAGFSNATYMADLRYALAYLWNNTRNEADSSEWKEVNDIKFLFAASQPWTLQQAHAFLDAAWNYAGYQ